MRSRLKRTSSIDLRQHESAPCFNDCVRGASGGLYMIAAFEKDELMAW